jgi:enamine deaminase RidA (YjgF/YER057c/UK114 family)
MRKNISSGAPWEPKVGYSRAVKVGRTVHVSGTTGTVDGKVVSRGAYEQAVKAIEIIEAALAEAGAKLKHVVRTRIYVTDRKHCDVVGRAHGKFFSEIRPASAMVIVAGLIDPAMLVEIEAEARLPKS